MTQRYSTKWPSWVQNPGQVQDNVNAFTHFVSIELSPGALSYNTLPDPRYSGNLLVIMFSSSASGTCTVTFGANYKVWSPSRITLPLTIPLFYTFIIGEDGTALEVSRTLGGSTTGQILVAETGVSPYFSSNVFIGSGTTGVYISGSGISFGNTAGLWMPIRTITANRVLDFTDWTVICNSATAITVTLPGGPVANKQYYIKNINTGIVTVDGNASDTIDGELTQQLNQWDSMHLIAYTSTTWGIL